MKLIVGLTKWSILFLFGLLLFGCENKEDLHKEVFLKVTHSELIYQGEIADKADLSIQSKNDIIECFIRTVFIMEGDTLNSLTASVLDNNLSLKIVTKPYDNMYWDDIDKLTKVHDVRFKLKGLAKGKYNLQLTINNVTLHRSDFLIN